MSYVLSDVWTLQVALESDEIFTCSSGAKTGASPGLVGLVAQDVYVPPTFELGHDDVQRARPAHYVSPGLKMVVCLQDVRVHICKMPVFF